MQIKTLIKKAKYGEQHRSSPIFTATWNPPFYHIKQLIS